ncbi:hypothetical protein KP509_36G013400 [Ceratopteris richardii]|uniref:Uncharacterized protein n=1 Tax=Ceratopteris richardii TaxID=49495 RepID=A0A8T2QB89_CERRI|nr:hypothetical protein KP509_36G013400 [Ceratopteris richardii]
MRTNPKQYFLASMDTIDSGEHMSHRDASSHSLVPYTTYIESGEKLPKSTFTEPKRHKNFWSGLTKRKSVILDEHPSILKSEVNQSDSLEKSESQFTYMVGRGEASVFQRRLIALTSFISSFGDAVGNVIEESFNVMEAKAADLISSKQTTEASYKNQPHEPDSNSYDEDRKFSSSFVHTESFSRSLWQGQTFIKPKKQSQNSESMIQKHSDFWHADKETQLRASCDIRWQGCKALSLFLAVMAMAAKARSLLCDLKEAKSDLAVAKERCAQLEEEKRMILACLGSCLRPDEEELVRIQLETLLAEKAHLAQENACLARENQFLREILEYHILTMENRATNGEHNIPKPPDFFTSDCNDFEDNELPPETIKSTIIR